MALYHTIRFWIVIATLSLILGTVSILAGLVYRTGNTSHRIASLWSRLICQWNGIEVTVQGMEHARPDRAQVFLANHQGFFDIFALSGFLPVQLRWVAKASLFRIPFVGWAMHSAGYISVEREDRKNAYKAFLTSIEKLKRGSSIVIFPEGTRSTDGTLKVFKKGGTLLAARSGVPIVPVTLVGTGGIIRKGSGRVKPGKVRIILSPEIPAETVKQTKETELLDSIHQTIQTNYQQAVGNT